MQSIHERAPGVKQSNVRMGYPRFRCNRHTTHGSLPDADSGVKNQPRSVTSKNIDELVSQCFGRPIISSLEPNLVRVLIERLTVNRLEFNVSFGHVGFGCRICTLYFDFLYLLFSQVSAGAYDNN